MVEEYMLLANQYVGKFFVKTCKNIALLRCHPPPKDSKLFIIESILEFTTYTIMKY